MLNWKNILMDAMIERLVSLVADEKADAFRAVYLQELSLLDAQRHAPTVTDNTPLAA